MIADATMLTTKIVSYREIDIGEMFTYNNKEYRKRNALQAYDIGTHEIKEFGHKSQVGRSIITMVDLKTTA